MKILLASSEAVPFAKTGGLADVCGALPLELGRMGHETVVIMPAYRGILDRSDVRSAGVTFEFPIGSKTVRGELFKSHLPDSDVPIYFVRQDEYFNRNGIYSEGGEDYPDNCERFVFFCRGVLDAARQLGFRPDLIHCNEWQTGLIPAYLQIEYRDVPGFEETSTLLTIHNMAYQGRFWHWDMLLTGLDWKYFNWHQMEFYGQLNLLKTGLVFSDAVNTVSPTYAREIQSAPLGCGLEGLLRQRRDVLTGIINGVDDRQWDPANDHRIAQRYDMNSFVSGKAACKASLQREVDLPVHPNKPLVGLVGRLAGQKGLDLVTSMISAWAPTDAVQWVLLGSGEKDLEEQMRALASQYPNQIAVRIGFSDELAHLIEAGADMFLLPSQYEPCGLNQLYSLKYGTIPVVHHIGGLADTVCSADDETIEAGTATGFSFHEYSTAALSDALRRACRCMQEDPTVWQQLIRTGMAQDWSWSKSALKYSELYQQIHSRRRGDH